MKKEGMIENKEVVGSMERRTHLRSDCSSGVARTSKFGERNVLLDSGIFETEYSEVVIRFRVRS